MKFPSPLRYPGGKTAITDLLIQILEINDIKLNTIAEVYAGGAGASLKMLYNGKINSVYLNDADTGIYSFWWTIVNRPKPFLNLLYNTPISIEEWKKQREIYQSKKNTSYLKKGFATFYLNRCNRSGIIVNGGPIGGIKQAGKWKIDDRFNRYNLVLRLNKILRYRKYINASNLDGISFIESLKSNNVIYFIDPPYYIKGKTVYNNLLTENYHLLLSKLLKSMKDSVWILTYDDCKEIRKLYRNWTNIKPFSLKYCAAVRRNGNEIMIVPKWIKLPQNHASSRITW